MLTRIKQLRLQMGITQIELAQWLGIDNAQLSRIENGRCYVSPQLRHVLPKVFGVAPEKLFDPGTGQPKFVPKLRSTRMYVAV